MLRNYVEPQKVKKLGISLVEGHQKDGLINTIAI